MTGTEVLALSALPARVAGKLAEVVLCSLSAFVTIVLQELPVSLARDETHHCASTPLLGASISAFAGTLGLDAARSLPPIMAFSCATFLHCWRVLCACTPVTGGRLQHTGCPQPWACSASAGRGLGAAPLCP